MRLILRPLFEAELPPDFLEILKAKLLGREVKEGDVVSVDILGKPLSFEIVYAEPRVMKVRENTLLEISKKSISCIDLEFGEGIEQVLPFPGGFVVVLENEVLIINHKGHKIFNRKFEKLKKVAVSENAIAVIHDGKKLTIIHVS